MIAINTAYLVGIDIWQIKGANTPFAVVVDGRKESGIADDRVPAYIRYGMAAGLEDAWLVSYSPDGVPMSASSVYESKRPVPDCWAKRVVKAYIRSHANGDYLTWEAIVKITPETVTQLARLDRVDCTKQLVDLLEAVFPICTGEHVLLPVVNGDSHLFSTDVTRFKT